MTSEGATADAARADVRELIAAKGHSVDNARAVVARLDRAPFVLPASALAPGRHALSFVAIDGTARTASTTLDVTID